MKALSHLIGHGNPPLVYVRAPQIFKVSYCFGDASGAGFGSSFNNPEIPEKVNISFGVWDEDNF